MVNVTITIPDNQVTRVTAALERAYPGKTPKQAIMYHIINTVRNVEAGDTERTIRDQVEAAVAEDVTLE